MISLVEPRRRERERESDAHVVPRVISRPRSSPAPVPTFLSASPPLLTLLTSLHRSPPLPSLHLPPPRLRFSRPNPRPAPFPQTPLAFCTHICFHVGAKGQIVMHGVPTPYIPYITIKAATRPPAQPPTHPPPPPPIPHPDQRRKDTGSPISRPNMKSLFTLLTLTRLSPTLAAPLQAVSRATSTLNLALCSPTSECVAPRLCYGDDLATLCRPDDAMCFCYPATVPACATILYWGGEQEGIVTFYRRVERVEWLS